MSIFSLLFGSTFDDLVNRVTILENKEQNDMSTTNDALAKVQADITGLHTVVTTVATNITTAFNDFKAQINSQPSADDLNAALAQFSQSIEAETATLQGIATTAQTDDPGPPTSAPVNQ